jgi:DNA replication licensing factor MCM4
MLEGTLRAATDPITGIIDLDIISTGRSSSIKSKIRELSDHIQNLIEANDAKYRKAVYMEQLIEDLKEVGLMTTYSREEIKEALKMLQTNDVVAIFGQNKNNPQFKLQRSSNL